MKNISDTVLIYWLIVGFIFCSIIPMLRNLGFVEGIFGLDMDTIRRSMFGEYVFYFILGYALEHRLFFQKHMKFLYCAGIVSIVITVFVTALQSFNETDLFLLANHSPTMVLSSIALYMYCKLRTGEMPPKNTKHRFIISLTPYAFGIYLVHNLFLDTFGIKIIEKFMEYLPLTSLMLILIPIDCIFSFVVVRLIRCIRPIAKYVT